MKRITRNLVVAGAGALSLLAAVPARADAREHLAVPARAPAPVLRTGWRGDRAELARERHELEEARQRFYARWNGDARQRRRFDGWYRSRCDELDRRTGSHATGYGRWRG
jgi:hypothetical protein